MFTIYYHNLQKSLYFRKYATDFNQTLKNDIVAANKGIISADIENVGQGHI